MRKFKFLIAAVMLVFLSCSKEEETTQTLETKGYNMLLIGNSFFKPYAQKLDEMAINAGFVEHISTRITRGGDNGKTNQFLE